MPVDDDDESGSDKVCWGPCVQVRTSRTATVPSCREATNVYGSDWAKSVTSVDVEKDDNGGDDDDLVDPPL